MAISSVPSRRFLRWQYYVAFHDDPELPFLMSLGLLSTADSERVEVDATHRGVACPVSTAAPTTLHPSVLKKRLEMFLKVFAAVVSPKQLYLHQQLFEYYNSILSRSETNMVKLAYDCILGFKPAYLMPVRENIRRLLDDKKMRDELVVFDPSVGGVGGGGFAGVVSGSSAAVDEGQLGVGCPVLYCTNDLSLCLCVCY
jgi:Down-regulated in metastasis